MRIQTDRMLVICTIAIICFQMCIPYFLPNRESALGIETPRNQLHRKTAVIPNDPRTAAAYETSYIMKQEIDGNDSFIPFARSFDSWPQNQPLPCIKPTDDRAKKRPITPAKAHNGFLFMKLMKTGGSTAAGINVRIMRDTAKHSMLEDSYMYCQGRFEHCWGHEMLEGRIQATSFAWTVIREPTMRAVSQFYHFQVSRERVVLSTKEVTPPEITRETAPELINRILEDYNFIGITERMEETAVCLMMLLDLKMGTILYLNAKTSGGFDDGAAGRVCTFIQPSRITLGMHSYFSGSTWKAMVQWDELLYKAVNRSLDLTIDRLGRPMFEQNLGRFREAIKVANERCLPRQVFPCTADGQRNPNGDCLWKDSACGSSCLDEVAQELGLWEFP